MKINTMGTIKTNVFSVKFILSDRSFEETFEKKKTVGQDKSDATNLLLFN